MKNRYGMQVEFQMYDKFIYFDVVFEGSKIASIRINEYLCNSDCVPIGIEDMKSIIKGELEKLDNSLIKDRVEVSITGCRDKSCKYECVTRAERIKELSFEMVELR